MERPLLPIVATIVWGLLFVPGALSLLFAVGMGFDAPGAATNPGTYITIAVAASFPILCLLSIAGSWIVWGWGRGVHSTRVAQVSVLTACLPLIPVLFFVLNSVTSFSSPHGIHVTTFTPPGR